MSCPATHQRLDNMPSIPQNTQDALTEILKSAGSVLPAPSFVVGSADGVLYSGREGRVDMLDASSAKPNEETVYAFYSTTKLITSLAVLTLVDAGRLSLDMDVTELLPELGSSYLSGMSPEPVFTKRKSKVTLLSMLNQTCGLGAEFGDTVQEWKKVSGKATGFTNSCKLDNLLPVPAVRDVGMEWEYGNAAEWLGILIARLTGAPYEEYLQKAVCQPLGLKSTTFYPHATPHLRARTIPLRYWDDQAKEYQVLDQQCLGLTLPRETSEIEYPAGGGGIYTTPLEYLQILMHLLGHQFHPESKTAKETPCILSPSSLRGLFEGTLNKDCQRTLVQKIGPRFIAGKDTEDALDWSTAMVIYAKNGLRSGRRAGSVGWFGAANTEYWIDPASGIAAVYSSNLLPPSCAASQELQARLEHTLYQGLQQ